MRPCLSVIVLRRRAEENAHACLAALEDAVRAGPPTEVVTPAGPDATAWNAAALEARGDTLVFLPGDTRFEPGALARIAQVHAATERLVTLGAVPDDPWRSAAGLQPVFSELEEQPWSVHAADFHEVGGFASGLAWGRHIELIHRLRERGCALRRLDAPIGRPVRPAADGARARVRFEAGRGSVALYRHTPALLPHLELGRFHGDHAPGVALRRWLLEHGAPALPPAAGRLLPSRRWRERWPRFLAEYDFWRGVRDALGPGDLWDALVTPPVILMYHAIGGPDEAPGCYIVPRARFREQMEWLARRRYRVIGLDELLASRRSHVPPPARAVVITFDDGYADNHQLALPELAACGFRAVFFLVSGCVGGRNTWDSEGELAGRPLLSWDEVRALRAAGMEIGGHTRTHPALPDLSVAEAEEEVAGARRDLEAGLGEPVRVFAYPYGRLDAATTAVVACSGYEAACCSRSGLNDPGVEPMLLRRVEVRGTDSRRGFARALRRGWVAR